jgi:hypothetical protein
MGTFVWIPHDKGARGCAVTARIEGFTAANRGELNSVRLEPHTTAGKWFCAQFKVGPERPWGAFVKDDDEMTVVKQWVTFTDAVFDEILALSRESRRVSGMPMPQAVTDEAGVRLPRIK